MVKVREMLGARAYAREGIEFDFAKRDLYVSKFLVALNADVEEDARADLVVEVHREVCTDYDLYSAICDVLGPTMKRAIKSYVEMVSKRGNPSYPDTDWLRSS